AATRLLSPWLHSSGNLSSAAGPMLVHLVLLTVAAASGILKIPDCFPGASAGSGMLRWTLGAGLIWPLVLAGAAFITSHLVPGGETQYLSLNPEWWITSVLLAPLIEELVYRGLFARRFRARHGYLAGSYFSAVLFAWVHAWPSLANLLAGQPGGVPPGPLLLALICDWLYVKTGSLWPAVAFHAACNATPAIFAVLDPRWLKWFGALYQ
ncbi:MAG: hypothetical protein RIQ81_532, partial [Pseudomonadota bacterium]